MKNVWVVKDCEGSENIIAILEFLIPEFSRLFGDDVMYNERCIVFNDSKITLKLTFNNVEYNVNLQMGG